MTLPRKLAPRSPTRQRDRRVLAGGSPGEAGRAGRLGSRTVDSAPRVTSRDVAERAGVAQSTVSLVLSGKAAGRVSPALQDRVRAAAAELDYQPSRTARALRL